ncbi:hypothetical protein A3Q32_15865 [Alcanivorax sp. KX64203]|nr:hypothetical protein A3Q32_15865 [Alcanivorax sp. KX64203]
MTLRIWAMLPVLMLLVACGGSSSSGPASSGALPDHDEPPLEDPEQDNPPEEPSPPEGGPLAGVVQKGPFQAGSKVTLVPLILGAVDEGARVLETTVDEQGRYAFAATGLSGPALLKVQGYWFDERNGQFSSEPITLRAVVNVADGKGNINPLTDLISARLQAALAEHDDDYPAALQSTLLEYHALTGLRMPPGALDMLKGFIVGETLDVAYYQEIGLLPMILSAMAQGGMEGLAAAREGFAAGGAENEEARTFWQTMWTGYAELIAEHNDESALLTHLQGHLSGQYPHASGEAFPPYLGGVQSLLAGYAPSCSPGPDGSHSEHNRRLCLGGDGQSLMVGGEYGQAGLYLDAPTDASYRVVVQQSDPVPNDAPVYLESVSAGNGNARLYEQCQNHGNCSVATSARRQGSRMYFRIRTGGEARQVRVYVERLGDGHPQQPMVIAPDRVPHHGKAGIRDGSSTPPLTHSAYATENSFSHYFFYVGVGGKTLVVDNFLCGDEALPPAWGMEMLLAKVSGQGYETVASSPGARNCEGIRHDIVAGETGLYYLRVHPDYERATGTQPSSVSHDYRIRLLPR